MLTFQYLHDDVTVNYFEVCLPPPSLYLILKMMKHELMPPNPTDLCHN